MLFRQVIHEDLGCASYLVGDTASGVAAVIDPQWDIEPYLDLARLHGVRIEHVLETHNHADHVSGHGRLARASGATIHVHELAEAEYEHEPFADGWVLELGDGASIEAIHTPGHRPEHTSFLLRDATRGGDPVAVLTGDSLFVGDVARPDLAIEPRDGAAEIFRSLNERLMALPDEVEVWPGHLGGSMCGSSGIDLKTSSTIGFERRHNRALGLHRRGRVRRGRGRRHRLPAAQRRVHRRPQPRAAGRVDRRPGPAIAERRRGGDRGRRDGGRLAHQRAVRRGPHPRRDQRLRLRHRVRDQGRPGDARRRRGRDRRRLRRQRARGRRTAGGGRDDACAASSAAG